MFFGLVVLFFFFASIIRAQEKCEAPVLNVGDEWEYKTSLGKQLKQEVIKVEEDIYVLRYGREVRGIDKKTMNHIFLIDESGRKEKFTGTGSKILDFPLFVGKKTKNVKEDFLEEYFIPAFEEIQTVAGTFKAFRIEYRQQRWIRNRRPPYETTLQASAEGTYWYAPEVKAIVKRTLKISKSMPDMGLVAYKLN